MIYPEEDPIDDDLMRALAGGYYQDDNGDYRQFARGVVRLVDEKRVLRKELDALIDATMRGSVFQHEIERLRADNERLRELLCDFATVANGCSTDEALTIEVLAQRASAALSP